MIASIREITPKMTALSLPPPPFGGSGGGGGATQLSAQFKMVMICASFSVPSKFVIEVLENLTTSFALSCVAFPQFFTHTRSCAVSPPHLPITPCRLGPVASLPMVWQLAQLVMKRALPSCAEILIEEKIKKNRNKVVSLREVGLRGIIDAIETIKCG